MKTLKLGHFDSNKNPSSWKAYIQNFHERGMRSDAFRLEANNKWIKPSRVDGKVVAQLQKQLSKLGYLKDSQVDGIFGYRTFSAVRLYQEYVRTITVNASVGKPDGIVGPKTHKSIADSVRKKELCEWFNPKKQHQKWMVVLNDLKIDYQKYYEKFLPKILQGNSDTLIPDDWITNGLQPQVIAIRRTAMKSVVSGTSKRLNNDVLLLLVNGHVFTFYGSTDPGISVSISGMPFLIKCQHKYRHGFHKISSKEKCYRAFRPATSGVYIVRDRNKDKKLTKSELKDPSKNTTINIHWSGRGTSNWSAGCQVIGGSTYMNNYGDLIDCWPFASISYGDLGSGTRGAYNVFLDLVTATASDISTKAEIRYTLIDEEDLKRVSPQLHQQMFDAFSEAVKLITQYDSNLKNIVRNNAPHLLA